jgi:hypothetical protein
VMRSETAPIANIRPSLLLLFLAVDCPMVSQAFQVSLPRGNRYLEREQLVGEIGAGGMGRDVTFVLVANHMREVLSEPGWDLCQYSVASVSRTLALRDILPVHGPRNLVVATAEPTAIQSCLNPDIYSGVAANELLVAIITSVP